MGKKKLDKEAERTPSSPSKIVAVFKNETIHFVIGLMLVIFSVYLLLAFSSFFFTGAADQSIIDSGSSADLAAVNNQVKNYAGSRGAQLASYLINDCFGVSSFFILVFLAVAGLKLMRVRVVRLWKWFIGCTLLLVWFSVFFGFAFMDHYQDSFIYLGGMHGYNVSRWLISQVGVPGVCAENVCQTLSDRRSDTRRNHREDTATENFQPGLHDHRITGCRHPRHEPAHDDRCKEFGHACIRKRSDEQA